MGGGTAGDDLPGMGGGGGGGGAFEDAPPGGGGGAIDGRPGIPGGLNDGMLGLLLAGEGTGALNFGRGGNDCGAVGADGAAMEQVDFSTFSRCNILYNPQRSCKLLTTTGFNM